MEPDDVYWTARKAVDDMPEVNRDFAVSAIARAILAERKRCAEVAEERADWVPLHSGDMRRAIVGDDA